MDPKFSIIIPVYNVAHPASAHFAARRAGSGDTYLHECLDSVLAQTFTDWEAICVDDGSTDGSGAILDEYAAKDCRFKVVHQENKGVAASRQIALGRCCGEWVVWVDADDWVDEAWISAFDAAQREHPVDMVLCDCWIDGKNGSQRYDNDCAEDADGLMKALLSDRVCGYLFTKAFSRKFILEHDIRFPPQGCDLAEDLVFCCQFLLHKPSVKWFDGCHYHYRMREVSLTHTQRNPKPYVNFAKTMAFLAQQLLGTAYEPYADLIKQRAKFRLYDQPAVSDEVFARTLPEICDINRLVVGWWHRILFKIAVWGGRRLVVLILRIVRMKYRKLLYGLIYGCKRVYKTDKK